MTYRSTVHQLQIGNSSDTLHQISQITIRQRILLTIILNVLSYLQNKKNKSKCILKYSLRCVYQICDSSIE